MNLGSKMVLDAQSGARGERAPAQPLTPDSVPDPRRFDDAIADWRVKWGGIVVIQMRGTVGGADAGWNAAQVAESAGARGATPGRRALETLLRRSEYAGVKLMVAISSDVSLDDDAEVLWAWFTRFDCARDVIPAAVDVRGAWLAARGPLGIDATWKPGYPEPVGMAAPAAAATAAPVLAETTEGT